ncbi:unnamed protein product [Rhizoctonia solani]|uniref:Uncharacterized protein n=1 Tax=Rhizoctonia solani TaxID=456999 RepID=A0A8H3C453_9AGAM|nr:unnamed protein product [Rhizoctonia solani]
MFHVVSEDSRSASPNSSNDTTTTMHRFSPLPAPDRNWSTYIDTTIRERIQDYRNASHKFQDPTKLRAGDSPLLLYIILSISRLTGLDMQSCADYSFDNDLGPWLRRAYEEDSYKALCDHLKSLPKFRPAPTGGRMMPEQRSERNSKDSRDLKQAFEAIYQGDLPSLFKRALDIYSQSIPGLVAMMRAYNRSISIIQSSGMGKSRLVDETSKLIFTIPINLREELGEGQVAYPPADDNLRAYFAYTENKSDEVLRARHLIFLAALFDIVASWAEKFKEGRTAAEQAQEWAECLKKDQSVKRVGPKRKQLYDSVINKATTRWEAISTTHEKMEVAREIDTTSKTNATSKTDTALKPDATLTETLTTAMETDTLTKSGANAMDFDTPPVERTTTPIQNQTAKTKIEVDIHVLTDPDILEGLERELGQSWLRLRSSLVSESEKSGGNMCMVYFDEAHGLTKPPSNFGRLCRMSSYHNLGKVLATLCHAPVFFVFLSTNSNLQQFAPSLSDHPSIRVSEGSTIFPPFTELPFDVFVEQAFEPLTKDGGRISLDEVCTVDIMSHFGRPMWHAHHSMWLNQNKLSDPKEPLPSGKAVDHIFTFALDKIGAHGADEKVAASDLAAIGIRVGINFESSTRSSRLMEAKQVESHMRVVYAIPEHREYMRTGTPSEPILAEAAARYIENERKGIKKAGPEILAKSCEAGFIARGERGELCGRLLLTIAHDLAIQDPTNANLLKPIYHQPIPVLDFLCALFAQDHHHIVLDATPMNFEGSLDDIDRPHTLREAFKHAYVSFSHFELAEDSDVLRASDLWYSLMRGCAIQAKEGQASIDAVIPIHMGRTTNLITTNTTSAINVQFKNRKDVRKCTIDRSITVPDEAQPVISIVFELGDKALRAPLVRVDKWELDEPYEPFNDSHCQLVARGHGPETFNVVEAQSKASYDVILGTGDLMSDFPRKNQKGGIRCCVQLKAEQAELDEEALE